MKKSAGEAAALLKVLANSTRLMLVCKLCEGEASVSELTEFLDIRSATVSQHLQVLRLSHVVTTRRDAQTIYYSLHSAVSKEIVYALYHTYCAKPNVQHHKKK